MRKTLLALFFMYLVCFVQAQHKLPSLDYRPQSPVTAAFTRYGDIPVDLSTGVPSISVPIYTLSALGINVPISISYHASGNKVQDVASVVGLGWTLNAGGIITRSLFGEPDEYLDRLDIGGTRTITQRPPWKTTQELLAADQGTPEWYLGLYMNYMTKENFDFHSDRFYYSLGDGESGIFRKDFINNGYKFIPYQPYKIRFYDVNGISRIEIIKSDGIQYTFRHNSFDIWYPEKIVNSAKTDSIVFYSHMEGYSTILFNQVTTFGPYKNANLTKTIPDVFEDPGGPCWNKLTIRERNITGIYDNPSTRSDDIVIIDSIVGSNTSIHFAYAKDRQDHIPFPGVYLSRITGIQVYNRITSALIKEVTFSHIYSPDPLGPLCKRLLLDGVQSGANGEEKYTFTYNNDWLPPYFASLSTPYFQDDFWGYKNNQEVFAYTSVYDDFSPGGASNRFPDDEKAQACILKEIKYPTGGKTAFEYECNRVSPAFYGFGFSSNRIPADGKVGGLRVKRISSYAYDGATPQVKNYEYISNLQPGYGYLRFDNFVYNQETYNYYHIPDCGVQRPEQADFSRENMCTATPMGRYIGSPIAPVVYDQVTEYYGDANSNSGKTVYNYQLPGEHFDDAVYDPRFGGPWHVDVGNYTPRLLNKSEYKNENGQYKLVRKTETSYTDIQLGSFSTGYNLASDLIFNNMTGWTDAAAYHYMHHFWFLQRLHYSDNIAFTELRLPHITSLYDYSDANNFLKTTTQFSYNQLGQQIASTTTTSKGDELTTKFTYPLDYATQAPYNTMVQKNILTPVIEQSVYKNSNTFLQSTKTNYGYWDVGGQAWDIAITDLILPKNVETKKGDQDIETRLNYYAYDLKGNPTYVGKANDTREQYLWGYNHTLPVAHVINASLSGSRPFVAYTSFEENATGNFVVSGTWIISGGYNTTTNQTAPTGKRCLILGSGNSVSRGILASSTYILSYWHNVGGNIIVSGNSTVLTSSTPKNGWIYVKRKVTGTNDLSISGNGYVDELRLYPETAQMTTFAYDPLVGMTAQCDANDRITYYSYDASGRLSLIKDDNGNILKKICYNFHGQPDACGENAVPLWQVTGVTRCKPCPQNSNYFMALQQREERDNNPNSDTYGLTRWVDLPYAGPCVVPPDWQNTTNTRCVTINNQNTGEQERQQIDENPCSSSYGQIRWVNAGMNTTACQVPAVFRSAAINRHYYKQNCSSQQIPVPYMVNLPEGAFTSSVNAAEANALAEQEAQRLANQLGQCMAVYVKMVAIPVTSDDPNFGYTNYHFKFYSDAAGNNPLTIPTGFTINFRDHAWWTDQGGYYEEDGNTDNSLTTYAGTNESVMYNVQTLGCSSGTLCHHNEYILLPGQYIIIP